VAPVHDVASPSTVLVASSAAPPSPSGAGPPPTAPVVQGTPFFSVQLPTIGGFGVLLDEHAELPSGAARIVASASHRAHARRIGPAFGSM
jgi:hypothetical protein